MKFIEVPHDTVFRLCKQAVKTVEGVSLEIAARRMNSDRGNELLKRLFSMDVSLKQLRSFTQFNPYFLLWVFRGSDFSSCFAYPLQSTGWGVCSGSKAETHAEGLQGVFFFLFFFN